MELLDSHCHLQFEELAADLPRVLEAAAKADVKRMITIGTTMKDSQVGIKIAARFDNVWVTVGVHPHEATAVVNLRGRSSEMGEMWSNMLKQPKVVAIGEVGLDYYKNYAPKDQQLQALRLQIEVGLDSGLPFVFHVRDAFDDFWPVFDEYNSAGYKLRGVIHSFTSGRRQLEQALNRGLYVSLNGIMTFTKDEAQLAAAKQVPLGCLLLETDSPFLTPAPERSQTCEPRHVRRVAEFLANLRGETVEELAAATTENAVKLFSLNHHS